jgi:hypothetical protein
MKEQDDAEMAYRRGDQQGACVAIEAAERLTGKHVTLHSLREWATITLDDWRHHGRSRDRYDGPSGDFVYPPAPPQT